ncbi:MAG: exodeoxyribonuclease VII small subunit [Pseudomonadota bacterium]
MAEQDKQASETRAEASADTDFAATVARLERLVEQLEGGDLSLEGALSAFEEGVRLTRDAQRRLDEAELRVRTLTERGDGSVDLQPFADPTEGEGER